MDPKSAVQKMQEILKVIFGDRPFRVVFARDDDVHVRITDSQVNLWPDVDQKEKAVEQLTKDRVYHFSIVGWPKANTKGNVMVPVLWKRRLVWLNYKFAKEPEPDQPKDKAEIK